MAQLQEHKSALIRDLDRARAELAAHSRGVRAHLHPGEKLHAAFVKNRVAWIGGAAVLGLIIARWPARTKKVGVSRKADAQIANAGKAGIALGVLKLIFDLGKPFLMSWATSRLGEMAQKNSAPPERQHAGQRW